MWYNLRETHKEYNLEYNVPLVEVFSVNSCFKRQRCLTQQNMSTRIWDPTNHPKWESKLHWSASNRRFRWGFPQIPVSSSWHENSIRKRDCILSYLHHCRTIPWTFTKLLEKLHPRYSLVSVIKYNHHSIEISQVYYRTIPGMGYDSNHWLPGM